MPKPETFTYLQALEYAKANPPHEKELYGYEVLSVKLYRVVDHWYAKYMMFRVIPDEGTVYRRADVPIGRMEKS